MDLLKRHNKTTLTIFAIIITVFLVRLIFYLRYVIDNKVFHPDSFERALLYEKYNLGSIFLIVGFLISTSVILLLSKFLDLYNKKVIILILLIQSLFWLFPLVS